MPGSAKRISFQLWDPDKPNDRNKQILVLVPLVNTYRATTSPPILHQIARSQKLYLDNGSTVPLGHIQPQPPPELCSCTKHMHLFFMGEGCGWCRDNVSFISTCMGWKILKGPQTAKGQRRSLVWWTNLSELASRYWSSWNLNVLRVQQCQNWEYEKL